MHTKMNNCILKRFRNPRLHCEKTNICTKYGYRSMGSPNKCKMLLLLCLLLYLCPVITATPTAQDNGLCGIVAATNIQSIYSNWSCTTAGSTTTNPCTVPVWNGVGCSGNTVTQISVINVLKGMIACI